MQEPTTPWPSLREHRGDALSRVRLPVGGIGTGAISLSGRGQLTDWEIFNDPGKGLSPRHTFTALRVATDDGRVWTRLAEGTPTAAEQDGPHGSAERHAGLPRFADATFGGCFPFGRVTLTDPELPVAVSVGAYNPFTPGDADASGYPLVHQRITVTNTGEVGLRVDLASTLAHVVGRAGCADPPAPTVPGARFEQRPLAGGTLLLGTSDVDVAAATDDPAAGTIALACLDAPADSLRTGWAELSWGDALGDFFDDFIADGRLDDPDGPTTPTAALTRTLTLAPGASEDVELVIAWHFPHRYGWGDDRAGLPPTRIGNHYATRFADAAEVVTHYAERRVDLERRTREFVDSVLALGMPPEFTEAALACLAVLKSPTCFRDEQGDFFAWEGCNLDHGSCHGSCTHVWNYQYALEDLFGELAWSMREIEFGPASAPSGAMSFRVDLPLSSGTAWDVAAADGQFGTLLRLLRTVRRAPDHERLVRLWPAVRRAVEFAWLPDSWDADRDGVMEGCQHNTMDVEWYGPSGVIQSWYLGGLAAAAELATMVGDTAFASTCGAVLATGAAWTDEHLFNGEFYPQQVHRIPERVAPGLRLTEATPGEVPDLQLGAGCTADQLVGDSMALIAGVDTGLDPEHRRQAWRSVLRHNFRDGFAGELNTRRAYATGSDRGILVCTYPGGDAPTRPFPYHREVWTGLEYSTAIGLLLTGEVEQARTVVAAVRDRHDGRRRNPFNEVECGNHYARSLAAWGLVEAWRSRGAAS